MQDAIVSHGPCSYSIHRPTHFQVKEVPSPGKSPFGWTTRCGGAIRARSAGRKVGDISGRPHPAHTSPGAEGTCLTEPRSLHTHPAATLPCVRQPPPGYRDASPAQGRGEGFQPQGISENHFQRAEGRTGETETGDRWKGKPWSSSTQPASPPSPGGSVVLPEIPSPSSAPREAQAPLRRTAQQFISPSDPRYHCQE